MLEGYIPTPAIEWVPIDGVHRLIYSKEHKENGFRIGRMRQMSLKKQPAWYCSKCDRLIINCWEKPTSFSNFRY